MMILSEEQFDDLYGEGCFAFVQKLINDLAPVTRRDEWWATDGPYEIIGAALLQRGVF